MLAVLSITEVPARAATETTQTWSHRILQDDPGYQNATVSAYFYDATTSRVVMDLNGDAAVVPASVMKSITTAAAFEFLGPETRFVTTLEAHGAVDGDTLRGDLILRGGGDPCLGSDRVPGSESTATLLARWSHAVSSAGIRKITGRVRGDASALPDEPIPAEWTWGDIGNAYGAGTSGLCFHDNMLSATFRMGPQVGSRAELIRVEPDLGPTVSWDVRVSAGPPTSGDLADILGGPDSSRRIVVGTLPAGRDFTIRGSLPSPGDVAALMLERELQRCGIEIQKASAASDTTASKVRVLDRYQSPTLGQIATLLNKQSFNLYAEMFLMNVAARGSAGNRGLALQRTREWLESMNVTTSGTRFADGSGLARQNLVTARMMAEMFAAVEARPWAAEWQRTLPVMGVDGDLRGRKSHPELTGRVRAKTGLINRVRGLAGYLQCRSGKVVTFGLFANHYTRPWTDVDRDFDDILAVIYSTN